MITAVVYAENPGKVSATVSPMSAEKVWMQRRVAEKAVADLDRALKATEDVQEALALGDKEMALEELKKVKEMLGQARTPLVEALTKPKKVVNKCCPMEGTEIDCNNVPLQLTAQYKEELIGFCCPKCRMEWNKLSDEERDAKLKAAMEEKPKPEEAPTSPPVEQ